MNTPCTPASSLSRIARALCIATLLSLPATAALAYGWVAVMKDTPAEHFDDEDLSRHLEAGRKALTEPAVGASVKWENAATKSSGEFIVQKIFTWKDSNCRELKIRSEARGQKGTSVLNLCYISDRWRAVSPSELRATAKPASAP